MLATFGPSSMESCECRGRSSPFGSPDASRHTSFLIRDILGKTNPPCDEEPPVPPRTSSSDPGSTGTESPRMWDDFEMSQNPETRTRWNSEYSSYKSEEQDATFSNTPEFESRDLDKVRYFASDDNRRKRRLSSRASPPVYKDSDQTDGFTKRSENEVKMTRCESTEAEWQGRHTTGRFDRRSPQNQPLDSTMNNKSPHEDFHESKEVNYSAYEKFRRSLLKHMEDDAASHQMHGGIIINPANYPMIDLRYAYALATRQLQAPQIPHVLMSYPSAAAFVNPTVEAAYASYLERAKHLVTARETVAENNYNYSQHQRYTLNDRWAKEKETAAYGYHTNALVNEDHASDSDLNISERGSEHPPSPSSSSASSITSPSSPQRATVHLPAYLRSRLSGSTSTSEMEGSNGKPKKCRRSRTVFTELQMLGLEKRFEKQQYLSTPDRVELAELLGLSQLQVKTWYQNRRMKWKKQVLQGGGTEAPTKPKGRPRKVRPEEQSAAKPTASSFTKAPSTQQQDLKAAVSC